MRKTQALAIFKELQETLTQKGFLETIGRKRKEMLSLLEKKSWTAGINAILQGEISCEAVLSLCADVMAALAGKQPKKGWLPHIYDWIVKRLFAGRDDLSIEEGLDAAVLFYLQVLRAFLQWEKGALPYERTRDFRFATAEEIGDSPYLEQYIRFLQAFRMDYMQELMRIGREIMPFDTLAHVAGVHHIAMHVGRQLKKVGVPVDLGLISGAAAGHDIGKYGCRDIETKRIPYLHYYYTDQWFRRHELPEIGIIAANHSTWDLELENLPVESLILIYADFRVKNRGYQNGKEVMGFFSLEESFRVILEKLDNVDSAKERRYRHVYSRLQDFEAYMKSLGVNTDLSREEPLPVHQKEKALLTVGETVEVFKNMAVEHNIRLMYKLSRDNSFGAILEAARSSRDWKDSRAYLNIFSEYHTYMSQKQKQMVCALLYEWMIHKEGDIRRQAAELLGVVIAGYDIEYTKEIPQGVIPVQEETNSFTLWKLYLEQIIYPDHKMTDRHRRWLGFALKRVVQALAVSCRKKAWEEYAAELLQYYKRPEQSADTVFILIDTMESILKQELSEGEKRVLLSFLKEYAPTASLETRAAALLVLKEMDTRELAEEICAIAELIPAQEDIALQFLKYCIAEKWQKEDAMKSFSEERIWREEAIVSDIFLDNLKAATPWKLKIIHIALLYERIRRGYPMPYLHVAAHLSNLLKVSEQVAVRHFAGETLVRLAPFLSWDQLNEITIELTKGLEIGAFEFSKYIPEYLGRFVLYLHPRELDEFLSDLYRLLVSTNDRAAGVALDTLGVMLRSYGAYRDRFGEKEGLYQKRKKRMLGMLLRGCSSYQENVSREAFYVAGHELFAEKTLSMEEKKDFFAILSKKFLLLSEGNETSELTFFNDTMTWNHIYRFLTAYLFEHGSMHFEETEKIAFFPGTYDPFSLGHKEIARGIRDMGFIVYLALDEFSWSKKTQPHLVRRKIMEISVADEENIYLFPENIPVNIANPADLKQLRGLFPGKEVYMVAGSDVVKNASSYRLPVTEDSIQTFPHILFLRESGAETSEQRENPYGCIENTVLQLKLPAYFEDISSTRIRENIDRNRDISHLIDPMAQNYIYQYGLYLREPQYKQPLKTESVEIKHDCAAELLERQQKKANRKAPYLSIVQEENSRVTAVFEQGEQPAAIMAYRHIPTTALYAEFGDMDTAVYIREHTSGKIVLFTDCWIREDAKVDDLRQILLTEVLARCLGEDFTYAVYSPAEGGVDRQQREVLLRQGFVPLEHEGEREIFVVDMKHPITLYHNMQTALKEPFGGNERVLRTLREAHERLQKALTKLYPGELVISFDAGILHNQLIDRITRANQVPKETLPVRVLGEKMCVPFGKILKGIIIPNTVTKMLHTEKVFRPDIRSFRVKEFPQYLPLDCQARIIRSFRRPAILVDDLLHKGYRIRELDPIFKQENVEIDRIIVGILSGRGRDLMEIQGRTVESVYFVPSLRSWITETSMYPFIGGDSVERESEPVGNLLPSINLELPYVMPRFLMDAPLEKVYSLSMVCLQNTKEILQVLEEEYQRIFARSLTLGRLSEVLISPRCPDEGSCMQYDRHIPASLALADDIKRLIRLQNLVK